ncbi:MAG: hypothetical protein QM790_20355 [Nibricoccus sp.]
MERRQFLRNAGAAGLCSCFASRVLASDSTAPTFPSAAPEKPKPSAEEKRAAFAKQRYSKLLTLVAARVDEKVFREIVEEVGRFCSDSGSSKKFAGQLETYLADIQKRWHATTRYDAETQIVQLSFQPQTKDCACPLMGKGLVPVAACRCSVGSMQRTFSAITGRNVAVELKRSILAGDENCSFEIRLQTA